MTKGLTLISSGFAGIYSNECKVDWYQVFRSLHARSSYTAADFEYYIVASSLFSSKIEGNSLDLNSFMNNRGQRNTAKTKEFKEIEDLVDAYRFAADNDPVQSGCIKAHEMLSRNLLKKKEQGKYRKTQIGVFDNNTGRPVYMAVEPEYIEQEMARLFADITTLLGRKLSFKQAFYYASMVHLWIAMIHPFADGNGRMARLMEKWFLAAALGASAWSINTEKYYWDNRAGYYRNISLGFNYYALKWERCIPFLLMLPNAMKKSM